MSLRPLRISYSGSQYVKAFDSFRGYGMAGVFLYHCVIFPGLKPWVSWAWFGVDFFFVVSGFLITGILLETRQQARCLRDFYVRRVLRIFPVYYLTLALFSLHLLYLGTERSEQTLANMPWFWCYLQNFLIAFKGWAHMLPLAHFWSLAIEEQFYMVWPFLVVFLSARSLLIVAAVASVFSCTLRQFDITWPYAYMFTFTRLEGLMLGSAIALLIRSHRSILERLTPYTLLFSSLGLVTVALVSGGFHLQDEWVIRAGYPLMALFFGSLLLSALDEGRLGKVTRFFTDRRLPIVIGRYSYGIYIFHWILHCKLKNTICDWLRQWLDSTFAVSMTYTAILALLTFVLAVASFHLFEKRLLRLKDVLAPRRA